MRLIDTHCHLCHPLLSGRVEAVLSRARQAGVVAAVCAAGDLGESEAALALARGRGEVRCTAGIHPHDAAKAPNDYLRRVEQLAAADENVAIGEIGLDYHYDYSPRQQQQRVFAEQLALAGRLGKPVVIHTREAFDDTFAVLAESGVDRRGVVFHSWSEGPESVRRALDAGAMVSFSGIVTFGNAVELRRAALLVPRDRLLVETDSPFLSPVPVRKMQTNEPANVAHVAACLAELYRMPVDQLAEIATANAARFFGLHVT